MYAAIERCTVIGVAMIVAQACAQAPVASVAVSIDPGFARRGETVAVTYRFTPGDRGEAFAPDDRVLVEFLGAGGAEKWQDHHVPPVPMSSWSSTGDVVYTRTTWIPTHADLGTTRVRVSLESARDGQRLPVAGDGGSELDRSPQFEILPGALGSSQVTYGAGFHTRENPESRGRRWTSQEAVATLASPGRDATLYVQLSGRPELLDEPQQVTIDVDGESVDRFRVDTDHDYTRIIPLTKEQLGSAPLIELTIRVDRTFVPADVIEGSSDMRELGVSVFAIHIDPPGIQAHPAAGLGPARIDATGNHFRWGSRRVAIYGPSDATALTLPIRSGAPFPQTVRIVVNDVEVESVELADDSWLVLEYEVEPAEDGLVRVEIFAHPLWSADGPEGPKRGVIIGDYAWRTSGERD